MGNGRPGPSDRPEIGILDVGLTDSGKRHPFFEGLPHTYRCLQWHSAEVVETPAAIEVLASTEACRVQAISVNGNALGLQYHVEITAQTVPEWAEVPEYERALERHLGSGAVERMELEVAKNMDDFNRSARTIYDNWTASAFG